MPAQSEVTALADLIGQVLGVVEAGELESEPVQVAYLRGALATAQVIADQTDDPARSNAA